MAHRDSVFQHLTDDTEIVLVSAENWRLHVFRGCLAIFFGLLALAWPQITLGILVVLFGLYVILEGALAIGAAVQRKRGRFDGFLLMEGIAGVGIGLFAFLWPAVTAVLLLIFIALWALVTGIFEIAAAVQLRKAVAGEWVLGLAGVLSIVVGLLLLANPATGAMAVVWLIGLYAFIFGGLMILMGFRMRNYLKSQG